MEETHGERLLLAAILLRTIKDLIAFSNASDEMRRGLAVEARSWLFEDNDAEPHLTSFSSICELMSLDTEQVRAQVRNLIPFPEPTPSSHGVSPLPGPAADRPFRGRAA